MKYDVSILNRETTVDITKTDSTVTVERDGKKSTFTYIKTFSGYILEKDGKIFHTNLQTKQSETLSVNVGEKTLRFDWKDPYAVRSNNAQGADQGVVSATMPGRVVKILVKPDQEVQVNQPLLVLEAMKMENEIKSAKAGKISKIQVKEGDSVESGTLLIQIE